MAEKYHEINVFFNEITKNMQQNNIGFFRILLYNEAIAFPVRKENGRIH